MTRWPWSSICHSSNGCIGRLYGIVRRRSGAVTNSFSTARGREAARAFGDRQGVFRMNDRERVSMEEIEDEGAVALPDKEVMSLLDVNANVDLGLDLAAPVDLAVAANLNVAAPIEAAASANVLSPEAQAISLAHQQGTIDQAISGTADATAPQHAEITQDSSLDATTPAAADGATHDAATTGAEGTTQPASGGAVEGAAGTVAGDAGQ